MTGRQGLHAGCLLLLAGLCAASTTRPAPKGRKPRLPSGVDWRPAPVKAPPAVEVDAIAKLDRIAERLDAAKAVLEPKVRELGTVRDAYPATPELRGLAERRVTLRGEIAPAIEEYTDGLQEYESVRSQLDMLKLQLAMGQMLSSKQLPSSVPADFLNAQERMAYLRSARESRDLALRVMTEEDVAYQAALEARDSSRRLKWIFSVIGAALAASFGLLWAWRRQKALTAQLVTSPQTAPRWPTRPGMPTQPALGSAAAALLPGPAAAVGSVLGGNYRVERELGRGGMGVVYEAVDLTLKRKVAVKRMHEAMAGSGKESEMFLSEARLVAALKHANIVEIYAIVREGGEVYLVFEYVHGKQLAAYLAQKSRLPLRAVKSVVKQVGSALDYAHSCKVIHRDLKPANILVTPEGATKVMDFGIAHQASLTVGKLTRAQSWGTPPYMAPEQELGSVLRESDLYSLGVCFYEMVAGRLPFRGPNFLAQKQGMLFEPVTRLAPGLGSMADEIVRRALQADPKGRFHSGAEFSAAVSRLPEVG